MNTSMKRSVAEQFIGRTEQRNSEGDAKVADLLDPQRRVDGIGEGQ